MTYGVDQCRRCGAPIRNRGMTSPDDTRPSGIPEARWRADGFQVRPTVAEAHYPHLGCCPGCQAWLLRKRWKPGVRLLFVALVVIVVMVLIFVIAGIFN